jgi:branched-chain amino acid transport system permease protein
MALFLNQLFNGIELGTIYASVALALVLVFRTTGLFNFAQGEMIMFSTFVTWQLAQWLPVGAAVVLGIALSFVGGALVERAIIRPMEKRGNPLGTVIVTIGLFIAFNAACQLLWPPKPGKAYVMPHPFPAGDPISVAGASLRPLIIWFLVVLALECGVLYVLLQRTRLGLALRGVASNQESARLVGVNVGRMLMIGWGIAAAVGAVAGVMAASRQPQFESSMMQFVLAYAFAAAALGGFDSPLGAVIAGLIVGVAESMAVAYIDAVKGIQIVVPLTLIFVVLLVRPQGMFGRKIVERV